MSWSWRWLVLLSWGLSAAARAELFMAPLARAEWQVERSLLQCQLRQTVPRYGDALFETLAGGKRSFTLRSERNPMREGPAELIAAAPSWNPVRQSVELGIVTINAGTVPLRLDDAVADRLLEALRSGLVPQFMRPLQADTGGDEPAIAWLGLSPVNFLPAYRQYQLCVAALAPMAVEQLQTTVLEFPLLQTELSDSARRRLDQLLRYAQADRAVTGFELIAISADTQRRLENLDIARQRLDQVTTYLHSRGVDPKRIRGDYHGERSDRRGEGRRSVTIRVQRSAMPIAVN